MCGIVGQVSTDKSVSQPADLPQILAHRGPDATGHVSFAQGFLGHTRLSIIDLDNRSDQPFTDNDGRYLLAFNGEIYNYQKLRQELEKEGEQFSTSSDTEVLFKLLVKEGLSCLSKLNGFFAFAFTDSETGETLIARDRMGIKPLWYHMSDCILSFASELRALLAMGIKSAIDMQSVHELLRFSYISAPNSILLDVKKLLPGEYLQLSKNGVKQGMWYDPVAIDHEQSLEELLLSSVQCRLIADVPVATFLSGGLDSSLVTAMAARHKEGIDSFSIGFPDHEYLDESEAAAQVARHVGSSHHAIPVSGKDMLDGFEDYLSSLDEPFGDSSSLAVWMLSREVGNHVKVALSGDGADELFAGYRKHTALWRSTKASPVNSLLKLMKPKRGGSRESSVSDRRRKLHRYVKGLKMPLSERYWYWASFSELLDISQLLPGVRPRSLAPIVDLRASLEMDRTRVLVNDMLHKVDLMSMAHGLEVRTPMLDHRIVEKVRAMSPADLHNGKQGKLPLREIASNYLPNSVIQRKKQGFEVPLTSWLGGELSGMVHDLCLKDPIQGEVLDTGALKAIGKRFLEGESQLTTLTWSAMLLQKWLRDHRDHWWVS